MEVFTFQKSSSLHLQQFWGRRSFHYAVPLTVAVSNFTRRHKIDFKRHCVTDLSTTGNKMGLGRWPDRVFFCLRKYSLGRRLPPYCTLNMHTFTFNVQPHIHLISTLTFWVSNKLDCRIPSSSSNQLFFPVEPQQFLRWERAVSPRQTLATRNYHD